MDSKYARLAVVIVLALLPPVGTWVAVTFFGTSLIPTFLGAVTLTVAFGFALKWTVQSYTGEDDRPADDVHRRHET